MDTQTYSDTERMISATDGVRLAQRRWEPSAPARGTVLIVHGLGEHSGRYEHVAEFLTARGWRVAAYDLRGHGLSEGRRGAVRTATDHLDDLAVMIDQVREEHSEHAATLQGAHQPFLLLGHSMGGAFAVQCVARALRPVDGLILSSPALDPGLTASQRLQLAIGSALVPWLALSNQLDINALSHDAAVVDAYQRDPLVHDRVTPRLARAIVDAGREVIDAAPQWRVPTLLLWAGADRNVDPAGSARFAARAPTSVVNATVFPTAYHEIFNEPEAPQVWATMDQWLKEWFRSE